MNKFHWLLEGFFEIQGAIYELNFRTQIAGVTVVCDAEGFVFKQLRHFTVQHARCATNFVQDSFPLWFRSIHIINAPRLFYVVSYSSLHTYQLGLIKYLYTLVRISKCHQ